MCVGMSLFFHDCCVSEGDRERIVVSSPLLLYVWPVSPQACLGNGPVLIALIQVRNIAFNDV